MKLCLWSCHCWYHLINLWNRANFHAINDVIILFSNTFPSENSADTPVQELWDSFKSMCQKCLELVPSKSLSNSIKYPWIKPQIKRLSNRKQWLYNHARYTGQQSDRLAYRELKKVVQYECRKAHDRYVADLLSPNSGHANKHFWTYIKGKRNEQCGVPSLVKNHQTFSDNVSKANILNNQFSSVFTTDNDCSSICDGHPYSDIPAIQIDTQGIINLLHNLDLHKAPGPDGIPARKRATVLFLHLCLCIRPP